MARTALASQEVTKAGLSNPVYSAAPVDGHAVPPMSILHVKNGSGAGITVTITTAATVSGRAIADDTVTVPAGGESMIYLGDRDILAQPSGATFPGQVYVDFSAVASVTLHCLRAS